MCCVCGGVCFWPCLLIEDASPRLDAEGAGDDNGDSCKCDRENEDNVD